MASSSPLYTPRPKRSKITIACDLCRLRKSRCDGARPVCGACRKRRDARPECIYFELSSLNVASTPPQPERYSNTNDGNGAETTNTDVENPDWMLQAGLLASSNSAGFFNTVFGRNQAKDPKDKAGGDKAASEFESGNHSCASSSLAQAAAALDDPRKLPSREKTDLVVANFFRHAFIIWLDRLQFLKWYEKLWAGQTPSDQVTDRINYAVVNAMFALEYQNRNDGNTEDNQAQAQIYGQRAEKLLQLQVLDLGRKDLLWALLLLIQWYQSINQTVRCRQIVRLCINVARNLELDLPQHIDSLATERERELSRRLWHGCVLMDRITAMVSNQPLQISQADAYRVPFFRAVDDEYISAAIGKATQSLQPAGLPCKVAFFLAFCKLHRILGDILEHRNFPRDGTKTQVDVGMLMDTETALEGFKKNLPADLRIDVPAIDQHGPQLHLCSRHLYIRILLFRSCFTNVAAAGNRLEKAGPFSKATMKQGQIECVESAQELLSLLSNRLSATTPTRSTQPKQDLPHWWHALTYTYTASTIIIAALSFPALASYFQTQTLRANISAAFSILEQYNHQTRVAGRCRTALEALVARYDRNDPLGHPNNQLDEVRPSWGAPADGAPLLQLSTAAGVSYRDALTFSALPETTLDDLDWLLDDSLFSFMETQGL